MTSLIEDRLSELGIELPRPPKSVANYIPAVLIGNLLFISGQLCLGLDGKLLTPGRVGIEVSAEEGIRAARAAAINVIAQARAELGNLDRIKRVVRLGGFIAAPPEFSEHAKIMNGASDLMVEVFGERGRHSRSTIGVASLPLQASVEVEAVLEVE